MEQWSRQVVRPYCHLLMSWSALFIIVKGVLIKVDVLLPPRGLFQIEFHSTLV